MSKKFAEYDPFKHKIGSIEHFYFWEGVKAGGDMAKAAVWETLEPIRQAKEHNPEVEEIWAQIKWQFEDK